MEYYSVTKEGKLMLFVATQMELIEIMIIEMSEEERQIMDGVHYKWNIEKLIKGTHKTKL